MPRNMADSCPPAFVRSPWSRLRWHHNEEERVTPVRRPKRMPRIRNAAHPLPSSLVLITLVVGVLRGSFSGIARQQRSGIAHDRQWRRRHSDRPKLWPPPQPNPSRKCGRAHYNQGPHILRKCHHPIPMHFWDP